ncbi:hypothetical protein N8I77_006676 [Diaporthe amygdali]|uniref:alpha-galactosidase n=1 Tax=Phomopsis amygdali TaxID=1214568 RepID=A0AAD9SGC2_PHOAM|nr:hypothetical protein N8I77_006676 [Diaporthe amygdali]
MPSFTATVLFFPLLGLCSAKCIPATVPQVTSPPAANESSSVPAVGQNATSATKTPNGFEPGVKWQINIQNPVDPRAGLQPADAKVIDVDLFQASKDPTLIPTLHAAGATVLCYFNLGAVQTTDCDWSSWNNDGLMKGQVVENYSQEKYVDVTDEKVLELHKARIDLAHSIGCDGLDPDNIDTFELSPDESIGKQITQDDMINFLTTISEYAHSKTTTLGHSLMIGQKNAVGITESIHTFMDFAISENCVGSVNTGSNRGAPDEFCTIFQKYYADNGKPVFDIEYPSSLASGGSSKARRDDSTTDGSEAGCSAGVSQGDITAYCTSQASSTGISRILKLDNDEHGLNGCTQYCDEATSFVMATYASNDTNSCG